MCINILKGKNYESEEQYEKISTFVLNHSLIEEIKKENTTLADLLKFEFIDFKKQAPTAELITSWLQTIPLETLLNKRGTTWRKLSEEQQAQAASPEGAIALMVAQPSIIKRPILSMNQQHYAGFQAELYSTLFAAQ